MEFAPQRVNILLLIVDAGELHEVIASGGVGAIGTNEEIEVDFFLGVPLLLGWGWRGLRRVLGVVGFGRVGLVLEPGGVVFEVGAGELMVEKEGDVGHGFEGV